MKQLADYGNDDSPDDDPDHARLSWLVTSRDDCDGCGDLRVEMTLEEIGRPGTGLSAHLAPATVRRLRAALAKALRDIGEPLD